MQPVNDATPVLLCSESVAACDGRVSGARHGHHDGGVVERSQGTDLVEHVCVVVVQAGDDDDGRLCVVVSTGSEGSEWDRCSK